MNFGYLQNTPDRLIHNKIEEANEEIKSLKKQINFIYVKHTFYNTGLFIMGMTALMMYILSPDNIKSIGETIGEVSVNIKESIKEIEWEIINQCVYVIDGKILILGNNPILM